MRRSRVFGLVIILLSLLSYANSFHTSFHHDDVHSVVRNSFIKDPGNMVRFFLDPRTGSGVYTETSSYRPLLMATFAFNYYLDGLNVFGYHLLNFILHGLCAILVYWIALRVFALPDSPGEKKPIQYQLTALFAALLFALHPVQTESVTYITGRSSLLTALFFLGSFGAFLRYRLTPRIPYLLLSLASYACALLVKETAVTLLAILVLLVLIFPRGQTWKNRLLPLLPYLLLSIAYVGVRVYFFGSLQYVGQPGRSFYENLLSQPRAWVHYLGTLLLPLNLNVDYDFPVSHSITESGFLFSLLLLAAGALLIGRISRGNRMIGFWALWFSVTLLPTNSLIALEDLVSDRWLYLPSVGFAILMGYAASWVYQTLVAGRGRAGQIFFFFLCALLVEFYGFSTVLRNFAWTSDRTLWEDTLAKSPQKARPHDSLGMALALEGRLDEAQKSLQRAIDLAPRGGQAYLNLGYLYSLQGKTEEAIAAYEKAIPLNPKLLPEIYNNLGLIYFQRGQMEKAETVLRKAVEIRPHFAPPYCNLGALHEKRGDLDGAIHYYEKTANLAPDYHLAYAALSVLYAQKGWKEKSREANAKFLKHSPR